MSRFNNSLIKKLFPILLLFILGIIITLLWKFMLKLREGNENMDNITPEKAALEVANAANQTAISISENSSEEVKKATASVVAAANLAAQSVLTGNSNPVEVVNNVSNYIKKKRRF